MLIKELLHLVSIVVGNHFSTSSNINAVSKHCFFQSSQAQWNALSSRHCVDSATIYVQEKVKMYLRMSKLPPIFTTTQKNHPGRSELLKPVFYTPPYSTSKTHRTTKKRTWKEVENKKETGKHVPFKRKFTKDTN